MKHVEWHRRENSVPIAVSQNYGASNMAIAQTALRHVRII